MSFVDAYRDDYEVEPICDCIEIAPSTYYEHVRRRQQPETAPLRIQRDEALMPEIQRVFDENFRVHGVRKVWRQLLREEHDVARCTVERLMKKMCLEGVVRGKRVRTTVPDEPAAAHGAHEHPRLREGRLRRGRRARVSAGSPAGSASGCGRRTGRPGTL